MKKMEYRKRLGRSALRTVCFSLLAAFYAGGIVNASDTAGITTAFGVVYNIIAAIISSIGQLYLLWGVFEWASSLNSQDGTMQSMAFKRIAAGLVACLVPQLVPVITNGIGG